MKKAFTLIELLVVTLVIAILASILFKLAGAVESKEELQTTILRMQKLENCLSGYFAAFGSYPPVPLQGRSRNPFYPPTEDSEKGACIQDIDKDPEPDVYDWNNRVMPACKAQPVKAEFPFKDQGLAQQMSEGIQAHMQADPKYAKAFTGWSAGLAFDGLKTPGSLNSKRNMSDWNEIQLFKFGVMSFLVPRYLLMMGRASSAGGDGLYDYSPTSDKAGSTGFYQWDGNNSRPCRFEDGVPYGSWAEINDLLSEENGGRDKWQVELIPSQAMTQRWLPNLEYKSKSESVCTGGSAFSFFGIPLTVEPLEGLDPQHPEFISQHVYRNNGSPYMLDWLTVQDGWGEDFFYYSPPPYQGYRLWSAGKNGVSFPPWFTAEEMKEHNDKIMTYSVNYQSGSISVKAAIADDIVHLSH